MGASKSQSLGHRTRARYSAGGRSPASARATQLAPPARGERRRETSTRRDERFRDFHSARTLRGSMFVAPLPSSQRLDGGHRRRRGTRPGGWPLYVSPEPTTATARVWRGRFDFMPDATKVHLAAALNRMPRPGAASEEPASALLVIALEVIRGARTEPRRATSTDTATSGPGTLGSTQRTPAASPVRWQPRRYPRRAVVQADEGLY
jgi:hypothetical protein